MSKKLFICLVLVLVLGGSFVAFTSSKEDQPEEVVSNEISEQENVATEEVEEVETEEVETKVAPKEDRGYGVNDKITATHNSDANVDKHENVYSDVETSEEKEVVEFKPEAQKEYEAKVEEKVEEAKKDDKKVVTENEDGSIFIGGTKPEESESSKSTETDTKVSEPAPEVKEKTTTSTPKVEEKTTTSTPKVETEPAQEKVGEKATDSMKDFLLKNSTQNLQN